MGSLSNIKLTVSSLAGLPAALEQSKPQLVISIADPDAWNEDRITEILEGTEAKVLPLRFHHVEGLSQRTVAPSMKMARTVQDFIEDEFPSGVDRLLVHCGQGESRSPSVAMLALGAIALQDAPPSPELAQEIVDKVYAATPVTPAPNMRTVEIADMLLGFDFDLMAAVKKKTEPEPQGFQFKQAKTKQKKRKLFRP